MTRRRSDRDQLSWWVGLDRSAFTAAVAERDAERLASEAASYRDGHIPPHVHRDPKVRRGNTGPRHVSR